MLRYVGMNWHNEYWICGIWWICYMDYMPLCSCLSSNPRCYGCKIFLWVLLDGNVHVLSFCNNTRRYRVFFFFLGLTLITENDVNQPPSSFFCCFSFFFPGPCFSPRCGRPGPPLRSWPSGFWVAWIWARRAMKWWWLSQDQGWHNKSIHLWNLYFVFFFMFEHIFMFGLLGFLWGLDGPKSGTLANCKWHAALHHRMQKKTSNNWKLCTPVTHITSQWGLSFNYPARKNCARYSLWKVQWTFKPFAYLTMMPRMNGFISSGFPDVWWPNPRRSVAQTTILAAYSHHSPTKNP